MSRSAKVYVLALTIGVLTAVCGAWKDTLYEPWDQVKFFRSPLLVLGWAVVLNEVAPTGPVLLVGLAASALERLSTEAWKAVVRKPPSKFNRDGRDSGWLLERMNDPTTWTVPQLSGDILRS